MISRYSLPEMEQVWTSENRFRKMLEVEIRACEAMNQLGLIPDDALKDIQEKADFNIDRINEIEAVIKHDTVAFLTCVGEYVGDASKYIHMGMTSTDVVDTAFCCQMKESMDILLAKAKALREVLAGLAVKYKDTLMMGRTHGIHAEPMTFGLKMGLWTLEMDRNIARMERARDIAAVGKISGAVGTFANISPKVEEYVCEKMGLKPAEISTQVIQRDRHAEFMSTIAIVGCSLDKFAIEIRNLQRTDIGEACEPFTKGQKGSSAMPHKKNPIACQRISGLSRILRGNAVAAMEDVALWHERDISHSSVERMIIPDSCGILNYMLHLFTGIMKDVVVFPETMRQNVEKTLGLVFSQQVLLALVNKGLLRETAYAWVQRNALKAWDDKTPFMDLILADADIREHLTEDEIKAIFDYNYHMKNIDYIFQRAGLI